MHLGPGEGTGAEGAEGGLVVQGRVRVGGGGIAHGDSDWFGSKIITGRKRKGLEEASRG